ncbi:hypothetical protein L1987_67303 [Smallanthus sonchifolius]|uniref:Uncharacterized protein n=1 Tax=Smallanthus sonchifolius TaxID=185202 RepID=A0ACB9B3B8_9ASTR|nr:hypothetical protein L1987_67303 [Smallanthus sonchifolius]
MNLKTCHLYDVLYHNSIKALELDFPLKSPGKYVLIVGSCNGLLCMAIEEDILIWNPSTRKSIILPYPAHQSHYLLSMLCGFGYEESANDYKVVEISYMFKGIPKYETIVKIYSLRDGNWKKIGAFPPHDDTLVDFGKFLNGALHWAARKDFGPSYSWTIVCLDLAKETWGEVLQPVYDEGDKDLTLGSLREWLCVLCNYHGFHVDLWVMKVYGVRDSWTKLVSIPYLTDPGRDQFSVPLCISNDGKVLLRFRSTLIVYDSQNSSFSGIQNFDKNVEAYTFVESLVSPDVPIGSWR